LLAAALLQGNAYRWGALALLAAAFLSAPERRLPANAMSVIVILYCLWLLFNAAFVTRNYSAESLYRPAILFAGFATAATYHGKALPTLFRVGTALLAVLVLLGLLQLLVGFWHLEGNSRRAAATFITPNTFAAAINLFLLPLIALCVMRRGGWPAYAMALWLFAGLVATESRGGYLGFGAGCSVVAIWAVLRGERRSWLPALLLAAGLAGVAAGVAVLADFALSGGSHPFGATLLSRGSNQRLELAAVALEGIQENPLLGAGANMYRALFEMYKPVELANSHIYLHAHNDYLQIWLEFGLVGLLLLGAIVVLSLTTPFRRRNARPEAAVPFACAAALASCFAHASVDFPLYVPFLLLVIGAYLGALAAYRGDNQRMTRLFVPMVGRLSQVRAPLLAGALAAGLAWLSQPVIADLAANRSLAALFAGDLESGLRWQMLARWLEPGNPAHYWAEAVMWREQASSIGNQALAAKADEVLAEGMRANPYEIVNHLERARLHRLQTALLEHPASAEQILAWTGEAVRLRPFSLFAQSEHARALAYAGRTEEAKRIARAMLERRPDAPLSRNLAAELL
jgi:O-antigen ligase